MNCPSCKAAGAYQGLNTVECPNQGCRHYSARQAGSVGGSPTATCEHDWVELPVTSLSRYQSCTRCRKRRAKNLVDSFFGDADWFDVDASGNPCLALGSPPAKRVTPPQTSMDIDSLWETARWLAAEFMVKNPGAPMIIVPIPPAMFVPSRRVTIQDFSQDENFDAFAIK